MTRHQQLDCLEKVYCLALFNDMIAYSLEHSIQVSDLDFKTLHSYQTGSPALKLEWSPQSGSDVVLAAMYRDRIILFHNNDLFELSKAPTNAISFNNNGSLLATTGDDKVCRVWYVQQETDHFQIPLRSRGVAVHWNQHSHLLIGESNGHIRIFDFHTKEFVHFIMNPYFGQLLMDLCWSPVDPYTFAAIIGDRWYIWNVEKSHTPEHNGYCLDGRKFIWNHHPSRIFSIQSLNDVKIFATVFTKGMFILISSYRHPLKTEDF